MNLQNMAPNVQRALLISLVFGAIAAGIYFFAIESTENALAKAQRSLAEGEARLHAIQANLARGGQVRDELQKTEEVLASYQTSLIKPLLGSTAMRAKSLVDGLAAGCGLIGMDYEALTPIDLPIFDRAPLQRYARCPIRISCSGSYQAAITFLRCVEKDFPLVVLESLTVTSRAEANTQQIVFILEWPMTKNGGPSK